MARDYIYYKPPSTPQLPDVDLEFLSSNRSFMPSHLCALPRFPIFQLGVGVACCGKDEDRGFFMRSIDKCHVTARYIGLSVIIL